jgi:hypothetical protein
LNPGDQKVPEPSVEGIDFIKEVGLKSRGLSAGPFATPTELNG